MNVVVKEGADSLTITQRYTLRYKLMRLAVWLALGVILPAFALYQSGTAASLACARESGAGVVCAERLDWLGAFARGRRYERVEQAWVAKSGKSRQLYLKTAADVMDLPYVDWAAPINAFIGQPSAAPLVLRDPPHIFGVAMSAALLLVAAYQCLVMPLRSGLITIFDKRLGRVWLYQQGFWRAKTYRLPMTEIGTAHAENLGEACVFLKTTRKTLLICWFSATNSPTPFIAARELAQRINAWIPYDQQRPYPSQPRPDPADVIEVGDPTLAYLLGYAESTAAVTYAHRMHLRMDRLIAPPDQKHNIRAALAPRPPRSAWTPDVLARELVVICAVDVEQALDDASPRQRAAIAALLGLPQP